MTIQLPIRRVLILGCSGSGKSTLARRLGEKLKLPVIILDQRYWRAEWQQPTREEWHRQVGELVRGEAWVIDGTYDDTLAIRLAAADTVIYLDFPRRVCVRRCLWRALTQWGRVRDTMASGCPERFDGGFLRYVWNFRRRTHPAVMAQLQPWPSQNRVYILHSSAEVGHWLRQFDATLAALEGQT